MNPESLSARPRHWFPVRIDEPEGVEVLMPHSTVRSDGGTVVTFEPVKAPAGKKLVRVFPSATRPWEILFLQMLKHRIQKWAPASGDGILVLEEALPLARGGVA